VSLVVDSDKVFVVHQDKSNGASAGNFQMNNGTDFACPLTGLQINGRYRFSALRKTGHVISEKALKEVQNPGFQ
jgi:hypothetical protein